MIKFPVQDCETIPWMTKREIPVIKAILSAWRERRRDWEENGMCIPIPLDAAKAEEIARGMAYDCELLLVAQDMLEKEAKKCAKR